MMHQDISAQICGLGIYQAKRKINLLGLRIGDIKYFESSSRRLTVLNATKRIEPGSSVPVIDLHLSGVNPIRNLPSLYQNSEFLGGFLWVFQHLSYEISAILDNLHLFFTPMDASNDFVEWIAAWFGLNIEHMGDEEAARQLLQNAVLLYRWRGTVKGLQAMLKIVSGIEPQIFENSMPYGPFVIFGTPVKAHVLDRLNSNSYCTIHFPVAETAIDTHIRSRIAQLVKTEKPAHVQCFISYADEEKSERKTMVIGENMMLIGNDGVNI